LDEHPLPQIYPHGPNTPASSYSRAIKAAGTSYVPQEPNFPGPHFPKPWSSPDRNNRTEFYHERPVGTVTQTSAKPAEKLPWVEWSPETPVSTRPSEDMAEPFRNPAVDQPKTNSGVVAANPVRDAVAAPPAKPVPPFDVLRLAHVKFF
jgi:hypothetical protein